MAVALPRLVCACTSVRVRVAASLAEQQQRGQIGLLLFVLQYTYASKHAMLAYESH
jgi:hypothetical protein